MLNETSLKKRKILATILSMLFFKHISLFQSDYSVRFYFLCPMNLLVVYTGGLLDSLSENSPQT